MKKKIGYFYPFVTEKSKKYLDNYSKIEAKKTKAPEDFVDVFRIWQTSLNSEINLKKNLENNTMKEINKFCELSADILENCGDFGQNFTTDQARIKI